MAIHQRVIDAGESLVIVRPCGEKVVIAVGKGNEITVTMPVNVPAKIESDHYTLDFNPSRAIIKVTYRGSIDLETRKQVVDQLGDSFDQPNPLKILLDVNQLEMDWSIAEQAEFADYVATHKRLKHAKVAVLHQADNNPNWFIDTCAFNSGCLVAQFTREKQAEAWLVTKVAA